MKLSIASSSILGLLSLLLTHKQATFVVASGAAGAPSELSNTDTTHEKKRNSSNFRKSNTKHKEKLSLQQSVAEQLLSVYMGSRLASNKSEKQNKAEETKKRVFAKFFNPDVILHEHDDRGLSANRNGDSGNMLFDTEHHHGERKLDECTGLRYGSRQPYALWLKEKCNLEHSQGCERLGMFYYPNCEVGYQTDFLDCVCSDPPASTKSRYSIKNNAGGTMCVKIGDSQIVKENTLDDAVAAGVLIGTSAFALIAGVSKKFPATAEVTSDGAKIEISGTAWGVTNAPELINDYVPLHSRNVIGAMSEEAFMAEGYDCSTKSGETYTSPDKMLSQEDWALVVNIVPSSENTEIRIVSREGAVWSHDESGQTRTYEITGFGDGLTKNILFKSTTVQDDGFCGRTHDSNVIPWGETYTPGDRIWGPNGWFNLLFQSDGNLVLYDAGGKARWASGTIGDKKATFLNFQHNGNVALYAKLFGVWVPQWQSGTPDTSGFAAMTAHGALEIVDGDCLPLRAYGQEVDMGSTFCKGGTYLSGSAGQLTDSFLSSYNQKYKLQVQPDGNLAIHDDESSLVWASGVISPGSYYARFQLDGNLVVYNNANQAVWQAQTAGIGGKTMTLRDDGVLAIYDDKCKLVWDTVDGRAFCLPGDHLSNSVESLSGKLLTSYNEMYFVQVQPDGSMVIVDAANTPIWSTGAIGIGEYAIRFQPDGNLVLYKNPGENEEFVWQAGTGGKGGTKLFLQDDGVLVMLDVDCNVVWSTS